MPRPLPSPEHIAAARAFISNPATFARRCGPDEWVDLHNTSWQALRLARPDAALPPGHSARILTIPRAVFQAKAHPCRPRLQIITPDSPKGAA